MKALSIIGLLTLAIIMPCAAQQIAIKGMGTSYNSQETGLYAAHATYPFGTKLVVTNTTNDLSVIVTVGGRIPDDNQWKIALSAEAAKKLEMAQDGFTPISFTEMPKPAKAKTIKRIFSQTGPAIVHNTVGAGRERTVYHPSLPFNSRVRITNLRNRRQAEATVIGRIAASKDRIIELSPALGSALGIGSESVQVFVESLNN
ncbi:hypothetical protein AGMMS49546_26280 [Spirochaetia bacterium]|nr:hypothetical protein AGMMS49546_26280 [Spirochaetia bacterium]